MRCTAEIISDVKENIDVSKEEMRMALLVMDAINFFNHGSMKRLLNGGLGAELTKKEFPDEYYMKLGITKHEWDAMHSDPEKYLGPDHIPGTNEWRQVHAIAMKVLAKIQRDEKETRKKL